MADQTGREREAIAGLAAAIASIEQHAEVVATMASNMRAQAADARRRLAALESKGANRG